MYCLEDMRTINALASDLLMSLGHNAKFPGFSELDDYHRHASNSLISKDV